MYGNGKKTWIDNKIEKEFKTYVKRHVGEATVVSDLQLVTRIENDVNNNPEYIGEAPPGLKTNEIGWRIKKIRYDAGNNPLRVEWADGSDAFIRIWDRRASYNYS